MQGMVVVGLTVEVIKHLSKMCQIQVKVTGSGYLPSQCNEVKHYVRFSGSRSYI